MEFEKAKKFLKWCCLWDTRVTSLRLLAFRLFHLLAAAAMFINMLLTIVQFFRHEGKDILLWIAMANKILGLLHVYAICAFFYFKRSKVEVTLKRFEEYPEIDGLSENMIAAHENMKKRCKKLVDAQTIFSCMFWIVPPSIFVWNLLSKLEMVDEDTMDSNNTLMESKNTLIGPSAIKLLTPTKFYFFVSYELTKVAYICLLKAAADNFFIVLMRVSAEKMKFLAECAPEALEPSPVSPDLTPLFSSWLNYRIYCNETIELLNANVGGLIHVTMQTYIFRAVFISIGFTKIGGGANPISVALAAALAVLPLHLYCRGGEAVNEAGEELADKIHDTIRKQILTGPGYQEGNMFDCICNLIQDTQPERIVQIIPGGAFILSKSYFIKVIQTCFHYGVTVLAWIGEP